MKDNLLLGPNLRSLLEENRLTMRALSRATGIPEATLSGYANGAEPAKMQHLRSLAKFFKITIDELLYCDSNQSKRFAETI